MSSRNQQGASVPFYEELLNIISGTEWLFYMLEYACSKIRGLENFTL